MTRQSYQHGYISNLIRTRRGPVFRIRYRLRTADGKWVHKSETLDNLSGKKAARAILEKRIRESQNRPIQTVDFTVQYVVDALWRPYLDRKQVKASTKRSYDCELRVHILPTLGAIRISDVSPLHIEGLLQSRLKGGSSPKTVRNLVGLLQSIFSLAVDSDLITRSPVRDRHKPRVIRSEKPVWSPEQLRLIVDSVRKDHRSLFQCAMLTGARLGELLGLQWKHIDLETQTLEIRQALWEGELVLPKTEGSVRAIYFGPSLQNALISQKHNSNHNKPDNFVFCKEDGSPLNPDVLRRDVLYPVLDRLGIPRTSRAAGFHTFRHSAATIVNQKTGNLKLVQKLLGHSNLSTTADVYTHTSADANRSAALALEQAIFGDLFQVVPRFGTRNNGAPPN
ncbi:MAG TPA: tyrosine-type recombinase/integrase [Terriglobales bacterium]|jgi:integrase|nr:tyrosine-type recombinase/integrase [Terriglobales bacterium]